MLNFSYLSHILQNSQSAGFVSALGMDLIASGVNISFKFTHSHFKCRIDQLFRGREDIPLMSEQWDVVNFIDCRG